MANRPVHWHEGMFLRPQHFAAAARHSGTLTAVHQKWDVHYNWGLRSIDLDLDALSNDRVVVRSLEARLRDGTIVSVPDDAKLGEVSLKGAFDRRGEDVMVHLGLPVYRPGRPNVAPPGGEGTARYLLDTLPLEDENTGVNPQPIRVRIPNLKLLLSSDDLSGYETVPLARLQRTVRAEATPELDRSYIPPLLACDAWPPLAAGILQAIYDRIGKKIETIANQVKSRGITFESQAHGDSLIFAQLRELNEAYAILGVMAFAEGVHPLPAYLELCRLVGQLAIFDTHSRRTPDLPRYDHDDLGKCFYRVKQYLDALIDFVIEPEYKIREFIGRGLQMEVTIEPNWLEPAWLMFIGVQSQLEEERCVRLLKPEHLDMKIGSAERVDTIFTMGESGLSFQHAPDPPRALPRAAGLVYFQINRDAQEAEWNNVRRSFSLAVRMNEHLIAGSISGQKRLTIRDGGETTTLELTLYVVPRDATPVIRTQFRI